MSADGTADSGTLHDRALGRGELSPRGTGYPVGKAYVANLRAFLRKAGYLG